MNRSLLALGALLSVFISERARACGGFFCSQQSPVVQNAERIVFVDNGDGTITAIVEITYSGPSNEFAWVLPVPGVPTVEVAETLVLDALTQSTAPRVQLGFAGSGCRGGISCGYGDGGDSGGLISDGSTPVRVQGSGLVGPYEYTVISVEAGTTDPAEVATDWLVANGYDVSAFGAGTLATYLDQGLNLLAFRLAKEATLGSIRPAMITFESEHPMIPILPTAVAAINDMGVLVFVVGSRRAVPVTYSEIEIHDVSIVSPVFGTTYTDIVSEAVDSAGGHAFITEFAGENPALAVGARLRGELESFARRPFYITDLRIAAPLILGSDGIVEALREAGTLASGGSFETLVACIAGTGVSCGTLVLEYQFDPPSLIDAIERLVVEPAERTEEVIARRPYLTRMFTTLDPDEMTLDPTFTFTSRVGDVSNVRTGTNVTHCRRRDEIVTLEVRVDDELVEILPWRLSDVPNPVRVVAYDLYGVPTLMRDRTAALRAAIEGARYRNDSGCTAREQPTSTLPIGSLSVLFGAVLAFAARRARQRRR